MTTILVSGAIANKPFNGGAAWTRLNYVLGLRSLGFDVYFVEQINTAACIDAAGSPASFESSANRSYFRRISEEFGLTARMGLICTETGCVEGVSYTDVFDAAESAALLVNISGHLTDKDILRRVRRKAYIDLDPGFTQFWHNAGSDASRLAGHDYYFTIGENIGSADCPIPVNEIRWRPTRQPAALDYWPVSKEGQPERFTTIASWRGPYGPVTFLGRTFGSKVRQFRKYAGIPTQTKETFEIALDIHQGDEKDRELLSRNSWQLVNPKTVVPDPVAFRRYVQTSGAEFSVAQEIYVDTNSGWFSDRTVRYLASGKPVLVEDTGFRRRYPVGNGLLAFSTPAEALAGIHHIAQDYYAHAAAARQIAEEHFDSNRVLKALLDQMDICA